MPKTNEKGVSCRTKAGAGSEYEGTYVRHRWNVTHLKIPGKAMRAGDHGFTVLLKIQGSLLVQLLGQLGLFAVGHCLLSCLRACLRQRALDKQMRKINAHNLSTAHGKPGRALLKHGFLTVSESFRRSSKEALSADTVA
jgi:hypothetical protein